MKDGLAYLYIIAHKLDDGWQGPCKIGFSRGPESRVSALQAGNPKPIGVYATLRLNQRIAPFVERMIHEVLVDKRLRGEWFADTPGGLLVSAICAVAAGAETLGGASPDEAQRSAMACVTRHPLSCPEVPA
jgi:hypothetical protein